MDGQDATQATAKAPPLPRFTFLVHNWPYILMLALALLGVAMTSVARQAMTTYWIVLAPVFALLSLYARWREAGTAESPWRLLRIEVFHWLAVMVAMYLAMIGSVKQMMNADASALMTLTILALGTFSGGLQIRSWRVCVVGGALAVGVPIIAWIETATLILLLLAGLFATFLLLLYFHKPRHA
ncbi:MAG TPA: hypothetical protein VEH76_02635 [Methylocystis sp.]|nr:hypothetical protein [Methylocystis sp.]